MATPMTADQRLAAYRRWGLKLKEHPGWRTAGRPGRAWGPMAGIVIHHTGDDAPDDADERVLADGGRPDLPPPLCHDGQADDGTVVLIATGRANHAGSGSGRVLAAMQADRPIPPPGPDDTDGNAHFYGRETMYSGSRAPTAAAYLASVLACAAICEFHRWDPMTSIIGHREWTTRKVDPGHLDMDQFRRDVKAALAAGPKGDAMATLDAEDWSKLTAIVRAQSFGAVQEYMEIPGKGPTRDLGDGAGGSVILRMIEHGAKAALQARAAVVALGGQVASLDPVDEAELAAQLGPILAASLPSQIVHFTSDDLAAIGRAVNDEQDARERARLGS